MQKCQKRHFKTRYFRLGDVVLVLDENLHRNQWIQGRIIETFQGSKALVKRSSFKLKLPKQFGLLYNKAVLNYLQRISLEVLILAELDKV